MKSQETQILEHLQAGHSLTSLEALDLFGVWRLGGRIFDLRKQGHNIKTEDFVTSTGKHVARYFIEKDVVTDAKLV